MLRKSKQPNTVNAKSYKQKLQDYEYERDRNAKTTKSNATRDSVYTYTLTNISNTFQVNHQQQPRGTRKYKKAHVKAGTIDFSRRLEREPSSVRTL